LNIAACCREQDYDQEQEQESQKETPAETRSAGVLNFD
jgi:hypothetical protein